MPTAEHTNIGTFALLIGTNEQRTYRMSYSVFSISFDLASGFISICAAFSDDSTIGRFFFDIRATNSPIASKSNVPLAIAATSPNVPNPSIE